MLENILNFFKTFLFSISFLYTTESYPLTEQLDIQDILFTNEYIYFITEDKINIFDFKERSFLTPLEKHSKSSVSLIDKDIYICEWENFEIDSIDEYSTEIRRYKYGYSKDMEIFKFHETLKASNCSDDILLLETSLPQLEKRYFKYNIEKEELTEYENKNAALVVEEWNNEFKSITVKREQSNILWIYRKILKF